MRASLTVAFLLLAGCKGTLPPGWVYVTAVTPTAATVVWTGGGAERVECRDPERRALAATTSARARGLAFARLDALQPGTAYVCRVTGGAVRYPPVRFRTAPHGDAPFVFAAVGDSGDGSPQAAALARRIRASRPAFLLHLGDIAYVHATASELDARFFRPYRRTLARVPLFPTPGNHDATHRSRYAEVFAPAASAETGLRPYAFDWGSAHLVSVPYSDFAAGAAGGPEWLAADLARARTLPWEIVFLHEPPFSAGLKRTVRGLRARFEPVVEAAHVDLVLAGHEHLYERARPLCEYVPGASVLQVVSGGGGAALDRSVQHPNVARTVAATHFLRVTVSAEWLDVRAIDLQGHVLDRVRRWRGRPPACTHDGWPAPLDR
jgi:acid phosphatase type 7